MYLINSQTGKLEGFNTTSKIKQGVMVNDSLRKALNLSEVELIGIHNHPFNSIPSLSDLNSIAKRSSQSMGIVICHDGTIFVYTKPNVEIKEQDYKISLTKYKKYSKMTNEDRGFAELCRFYKFEFRRIEA